MRTVSASCIALVLGTGCGPRTAPTEEPVGTAAEATAPDRMETTAAADDASTLPTIFGIPLGADIATLTAACPTLAPPLDPASRASATATCPTTIDGIPLELKLSVEGGRVATLSFDLVGEAAGQPTFRTLEARAEAEVGPGHSTRCESDDGVPFDEYMAHGWGGLKVEWRDRPFAWSGDIALTKDYGPEGLRIRGFFAVPSLLPDVDFADEGLVEGASAPRAPAPAPLRLCDSARDPQFSVLGSQFSVRTPIPLCVPCDSARAVESAKQAAGCTVDLSNATPATILGLPFGASEAQVEEMLGRPLTREQGRTSFTRDIEGAAGTVHLGFYDGCLAVVMFLAAGDQATPAAYDALREWSRTAMGPGEGVRCRSEDGVPDEEHLLAGYGYFHTGWRGGPPLEGSLRLERSYTTVGGLQLVFEASYLPLRDHAPEYLFAGDVSRGSPLPEPGGPPTTP